VIEDYPPRLLAAEPAARRLVLAEAIETSEAGRRLVGDAERERIDQDTLAATGDPAQGRRLDVKAWLQARADAIVALAVQRQSRLGALASASHSLARWGWLPPLAGFVAGLLLERIDNPRQVNLLSPPLLAFLLWNLAVYVGLAAAALLRLRRSRPSTGHPLWRSLAQAWPGGMPRGLRSQVAAAFGARWLAVAGRLEALRIGMLLHAAAAAWAAGVACSVLLGGVVHEYRVGWESTLLDEGHVHAVLRALFAPVTWAFQLDAFSLDEVRRLHFSQAAPADRSEARRWVWMYVALLAMVVLGPRLLLAAWAGWRAGRVARALPLDLRTPHYQQLLARVSPASVRIGLLVPDPAVRPALVLLWRQASGEGGWTPSAQPTDLLLTGRGDRLQVQDLSATAPAQPLDLVLVAADEGALAPALPALAAGGQPLLVLATGDEAAIASRLRAAGVAHEVLPLAALPTWREDARLRAAIARLAPAHRRAGIERLNADWRDRAAVRLREAMGWLASDLLQAAGDSERLPAWSLRGMLGGQEGNEEGRRQAQAVIAERLRVRQAATNARLLARHALEAAPDGLLEHAAPAGFRTTGPDARQAGLAGAAGGAALGASVDAATGLMTLGAASAMGGLIGGAAALGAVLWRRRQAGAPELAFDDGALEVVAQAALLRYLALVHAGRAGTSAGQHRWAVLAREAVDRERPRLVAAWAPAREQGAEAQHAALAQLLQDLVLGLLAALHGPVPDA
jgi:hypothetical protein